jgi:hypothetical protein
VDPRAGLDTAEKIKKSLALPGIESRPFILYPVAIPTELSRIRMKLGLSGSVGLPVCRIDMLYVCIYVCIRGGP